MEGKHIRIHVQACEVILAKLWVIFEKREGMEMKWAVFLEDQIKVSDINSSSSSYIAIKKKNKFKCKMF